VSICLFVRVHLQVLGVSLLLEARDPKQQEKHRSIAQRQALRQTVLLPAHGKYEGAKLSFRFRFHSVLEAVQCWRAIHENAFGPGPREASWTAGVPFGLQPGQLIECFLVHHPRIRRPDGQYV
jgi:hypothetical protein